MERRRLLVIEDEVLIGQDIVATLQRAGVGAVAHAANEEQARRMLEEEDWDAVLADANLNGRSIEHLADMLRSRGVPYALLTGYTREDLPSIAQDALLLTKPYSPGQLVAAARSLCRESGAARPEPPAGAAAPEFQ